MVNLFQDKTMTLEYKIANLETHPAKERLNKIELDLIDFININGYFEFYIENRIILKQDYWNVGELALQLIEWKRNGLHGDFVYECIDTEEEQLFSFKHVTGGFLFISEWADKISEIIIDRNLIDEFIDNYSKTVKQEIKEELGFDVSKFL